jgi:DNA-binding transcriptional MerR regulator
MKARNRAVFSEAEPQNRALLKIGEVARRSGVGIETLRFYEKLGLIDSPRRTASGYRLYTADIIERLEFIRRAQVLGFSLSEIARIIAEKEAGQSPCSDVREIVRRRLQDLDEQMREMKRYRDELATALEEWDRVGDREGHICGLIEGTSLNRQVPLARRIGRKKR